MKQIWAGTKFIWQRRQFPPNEFYVQFRSKSGKLKLYEPKPEDLIIKQKAGILNRGGGQKVQRKATGIEMRHLPTNTVVHCQDKRTPEENKERAMLWMRYLLDKQVTSSTQTLTLLVQPRRPSRSVRSELAST